MASRMIPRGLRRMFTADKLNGRPPLEPGKLSPRRCVPSHILKPPYADTGNVPTAPQAILIHGPESIRKLRAAGRLARKMLDYACSLAGVGVKTDEIDAAVHEAIIQHGAYPSPLNYAGFPKSICTSVNEVVIHGIPDDRPLQDGDILKIDISLFLEGVHGDNCATVCVGQVDEAGHKLVKATKECLDKAVSVCRPGACLSSVGRAVQGVADRYGYGTITNYTGHGIGTLLHMQPTVIHGRNNYRVPLRSGMIFTIEPMITEFRPETEVWSDGWTVVTVDGGRGAQFEHTVHITNDGVEVFTLNEDELSRVSAGAGEQPA